MTVVVPEWAIYALPVAGIICLHIFSTAIIYGLYRKSGQIPRGRLVEAATTLVWPIILVFIILGTLIDWLSSFIYGGPDDENYLEETVDL